MSALQCLTGLEVSQQLECRQFESPAVDVLRSKQNSVLFSSSTTTLLHILHLHFAQMNILSDTQKHEKYLNHLFNGKTLKQYNMYPINTDESTYIDLVLIHFAIQLYQLFIYWAALYEILCTAPQKLLTLEIQ